MRTLDLSTWNRREHFHFFLGCDDPFFGLMAEVEVTRAYARCKAEGLPFFLYNHYASIRAANETEPFRYRIRGEEVVVYDRIHVGTTLLRPDKTFAFSYLPYEPALDRFIAAGQAEMARVMETTGLGVTEQTSREDQIFYSTLPWINFTGLTHARKLHVQDSVPRISFGKITRRGEQRFMPTSIYVHHSLMDAYHVGQYLECYQALLEEGT